ncbi:MAG: hypothetical protein Q8Q04_01295 [archaeon]|nr:hypothetical protein [archaeon]
MDENGDTEKTSEIGLWIDDYESIFSDFDSRPYSRKLLSEDLLSEINRESKEAREENVELTFIIPKKERDSRKEKIIKKRIRRHFKIHLLSLEKSKRELIGQGLLFFFFGLAFMALATFLLADDGVTYLIKFLGVLSEPAGWFLFWEGLNLLIFDLRKKLPELDVYRKISKAQITFINSEEE